MTHPILSSFPFTTQSVSFSKLAVQALTKSHSSPFPQLCYPKKPPSVCQPREEMGTGVHQLFRDELGWTAPWICAKFPIAYSSCPNQLRGLLPNHLLRPIHWRAQIPPHSRHWYDTRSVPSTILIKPLHPCEKQRSRRVAHRGQGHLSRSQRCRVVKPDGTWAHRRALSPCWQLG